MHSHIFTHSHTWSIFNHTILSYDTIQYYVILHIHSICITNIFITKYTQIHFSTLYINHDIYVINQIDHISNSYRLLTAHQIHTQIHIWT